MDEASRNRDQFERDRRCALQDNQHRPFLFQETGSGWETLPKTERFKQRDTKTLIGEIANRISQHSAEHRRQSTDYAKAQRLFRFCQTHQPKQGMRGDREERTFHEGKQEQPIFGLGMRRFFDHPVV